MSFWKSEPVTGVLSAGTIFLAIVSNSLTMLRRRISLSFTWFHLLPGPVYHGAARGGNGREEDTLEYKIKEYRKKSGVSQQQLSEKAGVSRTIISGLESGRIQNTTTDTIQKIAKALGIEVSKILRE